MAKIKSDEWIGMENPRLVNCRNRECDGHAQWVGKGNFTYRDVLERHSITLGFQGASFCARALSDGEFI